VKPFPPGTKIGRSVAEALGGLRAASSPKPKPRRGLMNKLEARFASEVLDAKVAAGEIDRYEFEVVKLLAARAGRETVGAWYAPDFASWRGCVLTCWEVKGFWRTASRLRVKVVAERFPYIRFVAVKRVKGIWCFEQF
jgi:hypothetical protein